MVQQSLYSSTIQKIPAPKFIVFYNGTKEINDLTEFRLSSAYECPTEDPDLELRVTILNVNDGHNKALMEQCQTLKEYAQYVARVRKYVSFNELSLEEAVEKAVTECINENILRDFLSSNRAEVINMSIFEYDKELEEKKLRRAEFQAGMEAGIEKGQHDLLTQKIKAKLAKGKSLELIADELEEDISVIEKLLNQEAN